MFVGAGLRDYLFEAIIVGKTRPYEGMRKLYILIYLCVGAGLGNYLFEAIIIGETRP